MSWDVSEQAASFYARADRNDPPVQAALDRLWARLDLDPDEEGIPLDAVATSRDSNFKRIIDAVTDLAKHPHARGTSLAPRVTYEQVEGPGRPPHWLAFALHAPNWPKRSTHTLIALGTIDRKGQARR